MVPSISTPNKKTLTTDGSAGDYVSEEGGGFKLMQAQLDLNESALRRHDHENSTARAISMIDLLSKQRKTTRAASSEDEKNFLATLANVSASLKSEARGTGPRVGTSALNFVGGGLPNSDTGLRTTVVHRNLSVAELYEHALSKEKKWGSFITAHGALATLSGAKTGRSPKDKRIVREAATEDDLWWGEGSPLYEMDERVFIVNRERAIDYLNSLDEIYVFDGFANWDLTARMKVRVICSRPYHALFVNNLLIRPTEEELKGFGSPDFTIYNAGVFPCNRYTQYMSSSVSVSTHLARRECVILGTMYAGEMKKMVFSIMHYVLPKAGILSLHSGCNIGEKGDCTLFFGLSGTGKTTLSTDPKRPLIGDDEHAWSDNGVSNIEGGCYAKAIDLNKDAEPEIHSCAIRFGTVLENVVFDEKTRDVIFSDGSVTENTRAAYPIHFIPNARIPCIGPHPKNLILLCCDCFGVIPAVSRLTMGQAMYHFISGYTAKVAGTEMGVTEPEATFSACFGGAFLMWNPLKYAELLAKKMSQTGAQAYLVNTGWQGGKYGEGRRIKLSYTRAIVDAIHSGELLEKTPFEGSAKTDIFGFVTPSSVTGVPDTLLDPGKQWKDGAQYKETLRHLGGLFESNFDKVTGRTSWATLKEDVADMIRKAKPALN